MEQQKCASVAVFLFFFFFRFFPLVVRRDLFRQTLICIEVNLFRLSFIFLCRLPSHFYGARTRDSC